MIFARLDALARALIPRLSSLGIPYVALDSDPVRALAAIDDGFNIVLGERDPRATYDAVRMRSFGGQPPAA